jgi:hypothetical protein
MIDRTTYSQIEHRAVREHGKRGPQSVLYGSDNKGLRVMLEEIGQLARELNDLEAGGYDESEYIANVSDRLVTVAALAVTWHQKIKMKWRVIAAEKGKK